MGSFYILLHISVEHLGIIFNLNDLLIFIY